VPGDLAAATCDRLFAAARYHAARAQALAAAGWNEHAALDAATCAGTVVELLSKAVLVRRDLRLIAKGEEVHHHLLDLIVGANEQRPGRPASRGSIDAQVALALAGRLELRLGDHLAGVQKVLHARNEAVHMAVALPSQAALQTLVAQMAGFATSAVEALGHSSSEFWGEHAGAVSLGIAEQARTVRQRAIAEVAAAKLAYDRVLGALDETARTQVVSLLQPRAEHDDLDAEVECPACGHVAQVLWSAEADGEWDHGEVVYSSYFLLTGLHCPVCGLRLDGEEVEALELDLPDPYDVAAQENLEEYLKW